ncbi:MAG: FecR domain-containing protein [Bacteroides intestinalis]
MILTGDFLRGENLEQILRVITADKRLKYRIEEYMIYIDENKRTRKRIY